VSVSAHQATPTISPAVAGNWVQTSSSTISYHLDAPFIPWTKETVTVPGGAHGMRSTSSHTMAASDSFSFSVAAGDVNRLQQILAQLDFLPLSFSPSVPLASPADAAIAQPGSFNWRWPNLPPQLTSLWTQGNIDEITKAAVEAFEHQNGLTVDGEPGPAVWTALLAAVAADKVDAVPYVYVLVSKIQPETLTLYKDGVPDFSNVLVNTGAPGADTADGTYAVFEHVTSSDMKGTNPDGTTYNDPNVPWASYFNGGDALHGFVRSQYGFPQSNGCVEMAIANAALIWPLTPIGTLVTVFGPSSGPGPTTTTTTSTSTTTTTAPPATTTTTTAPGATTTTTTTAAA
jgi:peptidoglycan hydrolase-like protein with peptidoglycan-binding domain